MPRTITTEGFETQSHLCCKETIVDKPNEQTDGPLSPPGSIFQILINLSDLSIVGTCDIFVYRMRHHIM